MKLLRKYMKHILAVSGALLLVVWLGGDALMQALTPDPSKELIGRAATGNITRYDRNVAEYNRDLQQALGFTWGDLVGPQVDVVDWILLRREAESYGIDFSLNDARRYANQLGYTEEIIDRVLARRRQVTRQDDTRERVYVALADYFTVAKMRTLIQSTTTPTENAVRAAVRDWQERATIEAVKFPAVAFADPDQTFSEDQLQAHFAKYRDQRGVEGSQSFGYFQDAQVKVQYIHIDPEIIQENLRVSERGLRIEALEFFQANRQDQRFMLPSEEVRRRLQEAQAKRQAGEQVPQPKLHYDKFEEVEDVAIQAVKEQKAEREALRIANELLRLLSRYWYDVQAQPTEYKPAPEEVKTIDHYQEVIAQLPNNLRYEGAIRVEAMELMTAEELAELEGIGSAPEFTQLAFTVEGLAEIPKDVEDKSLYTSLWETYSRPLTKTDGVTEGIYLFRVIEVEPEHAPESLDVVRDQVIRDLRLAAGMEAARAAAEDFLATVGTGGLANAWDEESELADRLGPEDGGFVRAQGFARRQRYGTGRFIPQIGEVSQRFMNKAFELAANPGPENAEVVELPEHSMVVVMEGVSLDRLKENTYPALRSSARQQLAQRRLQEVVGNWLNPKQIRERNQFELVGES